MEKKGTKYVQYCSDKDNSYFKPSARNPLVVDGIRFIKIFTISDLLDLCKEEDKEAKLLFDRINRAVGLCKFDNFDDEDKKILNKIFQDVYEKLFGLTENGAIISLDSKIIGDKNKIGNNAIIIGSVLDSTEGLVEIKENAIVINSLCKEISIEKLIINSNNEGIGIGGFDKREELFKEYDEKETIQDKIKKLYDERNIKITSILPEIENMFDDTEKDSSCILM